MITFDELHYHLQLDPFYGYPPLKNRRGQEETSNSAANDEATEPPTLDEGARNAEYATDAIPESFATHALRLVEKTYTQLNAVRRAQEAQRAFRRNAVIKYDIHRELIYLWCSFLGLPTYRKGKRLEWSWRDLVDHWNVDFEFKEDELREFLRRQKLPLPGEFFPNEPDRSNDPTIIDMVVAWLNTESVAEAPQEHLRRQARAQRDQRWQARIDQLHDMPEHRNLTHKELSKMVAGELIGEFADAATIMRQTSSPNPKK